MRIAGLLIILCLIFPLTALAQDDISIGDTVEGTLDNNAPEVKYLLTAEQGQFVTITMTSTDSDVDPYLRVETSDGEILAEDDDSAGSLNARISGFEIPSNDPLTIVATTLNGRGEGDFSVSVVTQTVNKVEYTQVIEGELTASDPIIEYRFTGSEGDVVVISMEAVTSDLDTRMSLASAEEASIELIGDDDSGIGSNAQIGPFELPETGEYIISASSYGGGEVGEFVLSIQRVEVTTLELGTPAEGEISGNMVFYTFEGKTGMGVSISVESDDSVDTTLSVRDPDNYEIATDDDSGGRIDPEINSLVLAQDGTYTVMVMPYSSTEEGSFTIEVREYELPSLDEGSQTVRVSDKQTQQVLTFTGVADETVRLSITVEDNLTISPSVSVLQEGTTVSYASTSTVSEMSFTFTVPADGAVNVQIDDYTYEQRTLNVTLERLTEK